jgi:hypothetical protein
MRQAFVSLGSVVLLAFSLYLYGCSCGDGYSCQPNPPPGGNGPIHTWSGANSLKLTSRVCARSAQCAFAGGAPPTGAGATESFCMCALSDRFDTGNSIYECHAGGTRTGASSGRCVWQVSESSAGFVCVANTPYVCGNGTTVVMCNGAGTGWNTTCP